MYWAWLGIEFTLVNFTALVSILQLVCRSLWQSVLQTRIWILIACVSYMNQPPGQLNATFCTSNLRQGEEFHARAEDSRCCVFRFAGTTGQWMRSTSYNWRKHMILCDKWVWIRCPQSWKGALDFSLSCRIGFAQYLATIGSATCLLCSSTKQSHLTSWLNDDCIMITPMDSEVALIFNVFMLPFHHSLPRLLYQSLIPLTFCCYLPDSALDTAFWGWKMIEEWNRTPSLATWVGRSSVQESCDRSRMLYHVVPCCTKYS